MEEVIFEVSLKLGRSKDRNVICFEKKDTFKYSEMRSCKASLKTSEQIQLYKVPKVEIKEKRTEVGS